MIAIRFAKQSSTRSTLILSVLLLASSYCVAQVPIVPGPPQKVRTAENQNGVFLPTDRMLSRGIQRAQERIAAGEYSQAIRFLDEVLQPQKEDSFLVTAEQGEFAGLKESARRIINQLPPEGKQFYEATYGPVARRELGDAIAMGQVEAIRQVAYRYFHTAAGYEAALLLAQHEADMGRHLSAALIYEELLASPQASARFEPQLSLLAVEAWVAAESLPHAEALLKNLRDQEHRTATIAGKQLSLNRMGPQPLEWFLDVVGTPAGEELDTEPQWLTYRGNPSRNGQVDGGLPHMRVRWAVRLLGHPDLEEVYDNVASEMLRHRKSMAVASSPLAAGDYIITRTAHNLIAVDYRTGKRIWQSQLQRVEEFERLINSSTETSEDLGEVEPTRAFAERIWQDYLYNSISSDGQRVYVIRDLSLPEKTHVDPFVMPGMRGSDSSADSVRTNRLCAYELATQGKLVWEIDGAAPRSELAGAFFLGAPLSIGQSLYGLMEIKSAVYLVVLDRRTGEIQWQQQLVSLESDILLDTQRRLQATIPSYDAGILVCPTGAGVVVGVDLAKQTLAWAYRYDTDRQKTHLFRMRYDRDRVIDQHWIDSAPIVVAGRVLLSAPESDSLHCLDLASGKLLWKVDRNRRLTVAGVQEDRVLIVGSKDVIALRLADGKPGWPRPKLDLPEGALPSGRGFFSRGRYYLPLTTSEVLAVDVQTGEIVDRAVSRDGQVLGNLICHRGAVLSQNGRFLDCFDQVDVLRSESEKILAQNSNDFEALRTLGEIAYNEGRLQQAIEYLVRALAGANDDLRTREVLVECLEVALDEDFATYHSRLPLLRELGQTSGSRQLHLLRLEADGLLELGDPWSSFEACMKMYQATDSLSEVLQLQRNHEVQLSRWLRGQVASIWRLAGNDERKRIARQLDDLLVHEQSQGDGLAQRFADCFGTLEITEQGLLRSAAERLAAGRLLEAQQLYLRLAESTNETVRAEAVARCSQMLHDRQLHRLCQPFDDQLRGEFSDVVCVDGKTGKECLEEWGNVEASNGLDWPYGLVEVTRLPTGGRSTGRPGGSQISRLRLERTDAVLGRGRIFMSARGRRQVLARNSVGQTIFSAKLDDQQRLQMFDQGSYYGVTRGNLLVISEGSQLMAFDTLAEGESLSEKLLWRVKVVNRINDRNRSRVVSSARNGRRPGPSQARRPQLEGVWTGVVGPLTHDSCIYQDQRRLVCVDSITGETRWWRSDVPPGCDLYGDEEVVFAVPHNSKQAFVYSTIDGRLIGESSVPVWQEQLATLGRQVIRWRTLTDRQQELSAVDALTGEDLWKLPFQRGSLVDIAEGRYVGIMEPTGTCTIVDAASGEILVAHSTETKSTAKIVYLLAGSSSFIMVTSEPSKSSRERPISPLNQWDYALIDGNVFVFDRHSGEALWSRPAKVQRESLMLSQPVDLPVIAFAGTIGRRNSSGGAPAISMLLLEKASGRLLYHDDTLPQSGASYCNLSIIEEKSHEMAVEMATKSIHLKFTGQPRPPEPPAIVGGVKKGPSGLFGIGRKLFGGD